MIFLAVFLILVFVILVFVAAEIVSIGMNRRNKK